MVHLILKNFLLGKRQVTYTLIIILINKSVDIFFKPVFKQLNYAALIHEFSTRDCKITQTHIELGNV